MAVPFLFLNMNNNYDFSDEYFRPDRIDAFDLSPYEFIKMFRLSKSLVRQLCDELYPELCPNSLREDAFSVETKVLTALRFFATGSYQQSIANDFCIRMSQPSASNCIRSVSNAICSRMLHSWISFPDEAQKLAEIKRKFYELSGFPGIIGALDCTHVALFGVSRRDFDEQTFVNRKNYYSLNVQIICDSDLKILNVDARFPGATHDAFVWKSSLIYRKFLSGNLCSGGCSWLIGDSGYPLQPWLMTPVTNAPDGSCHARYNRAHILARNVVERCNGVLKSRFRCLLKHRALHYDPITASKIIYACSVLHNMCIGNNIAPIQEDDDDDDDDEHSSSDGNFDSGRGTSTTRRALNMREALIQSRFG